MIRYLNNYQWNNYWWGDSDSQTPLRLKFVSLVSPMWSVAVREFCCAPSGACDRGNPMGLQPAPPLPHQKRAVRCQHWEAAGPVSSGHHTLRQLPVTRQKQGKCWEVSVLTLDTVLSPTSHHTLVVLFDFHRRYGGRSCSQSFVIAQELHLITASCWLLLRVETFSVYLSGTLCFIHWRLFSNSAHCLADWFEMAVLILM